MLRPLPDPQRQFAIDIIYITIKTKTFVVAIVGRSAVVMTADEAEKASVDFWSAATYARRDTAYHEHQDAMRRRVIRPRKAKKGSIPMVPD